VTFFIRIRLEWKVKRSGKMLSRALKIAGISVSIVTLDDGTIWPILYLFIFVQLILACRRRLTASVSRFDEITRRTQCPLAAVALSAVSFSSSPRKKDAAAIAHARLIPD
jgi:hypothetical protein